MTSTVTRDSLYMRLCLSDTEQKHRDKRLCLSATHCNTLQHTARDSVSLRQSRSTVTRDSVSLQHTATHCNTLQHTATHCKRLCLTATHCKRQCLLPQCLLQCVYISTVPPHMNSASRPSASIYTHRVSTYEPL